MKRIYLDANIWNRLIDPEGSGVQRGLDAAVTAGDLQVICSLPVLEEILATWHSNPTKGRAMRDLAFALANRTWIREIIERIGLEIDHGGSLDEDTLYLSRSDRRKIKGFSDRDIEALEIADQMRALTERFKEDEERTRETLAEKMGLKPGVAELRDVLRSWFEEVDMEEWCLDALSPEHVAAIERTGVTPSLTTVPSLWLFVRFKMARIVQCVGENRRISGSDLTDCRHYAGGAYFDVLITEDRRFAETCGLLTETPFAVWLLDDLDNHLGSEGHTRPALETGGGDERPV